MAAFWIESPSILFLRVWGRGWLGVPKVRQEVFSAQTNMPEILSWRRQSLGVAMSSEPLGFFCLPLCAEPRVSPSETVSWYSWDVRDMPDGKRWGGSWEEAFWEPQGGSACAGDVEEGRWEHPGSKMIDLRLGAILDYVVLHGEFPFS